MYKILVLFCVVFFNSTFAADITPYKAGQTVTDSEAKGLQDKYKKRAAQAWKKTASIDALNKDKNADLIQYGIKVLDKTAETIGPKVKNKKLRYSGNSLNCSSCHLKGDTQLPGTKQDAMPFTNIANDYPQFRSRGMSIVTAAARINGCMTRSMGDGKELPLDSREMKGMLAYFDWLAEGTDKNKAMMGTGLPNIIFPQRKGDVIAGEMIYQQNCLSCHGQRALGIKSPDYTETASYIFPPIAGDDSYNDGAGMSRLMKASNFIHANMPLGVNSKNPKLTHEQAYDVAAYILSLPRGLKAGRDKDFPDKNFRPADYPVPAYFGDDAIALEKAKLGPYTK